MDRLRQSVLAAQERLGSRAEAWDAVLAVVAAAGGLASEVPDEPDLEVWRDPASAALLGAVHESTVAGRHESGTFYTPPALVEWLLDRTLPETGLPQVLDPSCGAGHFLLAVVCRLVSRGVAPDVAVGCVHGIDLDPVAVAITRLLLQLQAPGTEPSVTVGDGLAHRPTRRYDVVVGNPPFLGQLRRRTARPAGQRGGAGAYTDTSALFLARALDLVGPGARVGLVQPLSLLAARDAGPVRRAVTEAGALTAFWSSAEPVFAGTSVLTCAPVVTVGAQAAPVPTWTGPAALAGPSVAMPEHEWGPLAAPALGIPSVTPRTSGTLGTLSSCTADFRDQYYGLVPFVREGGQGAPLITSGLIDPAVCLWGRRSTRFARVAYERPTVDLAGVRSSDLAAWLERRLVPKVLVATQGRVVEAVADPDGVWVPSVPVLTVVPHDSANLWRVLAVLLAPPVAALAAARYLGTALSARAIKLSARQVSALPLPADAAAWADGAELARQAQTGPVAERGHRLAALAEVMGRAYDETAATRWWLDRAISPGDNAPSTRRKSEPEE